jgi:hypothetical protein
MYIILLFIYYIKINLDACSVILTKGRIYRSNCMEINDLGFYFMVFQPDYGKDRVKLWLDGESSYRYLRTEKFKELIPMQMEVPMNYALMESSLFLWDVIGGKLSRLRFQGDEAPLIEWIKAKKTEHMKAETKDDVSQSKWRRTFDLKDGGDVQMISHQ